MEELSRYEFSYDGILYFKGGSKDEKKLVFDKYIFDLETGRGADYSNSDDLSIVYLHGFSVPYIQRPGMPTSLALFDDDNYDDFGVLYWWEDGENYREIACPYKGDVVYEHRDKSVAAGWWG